MTRSGHPTPTFHEQILFESDRSRLGMLECSPRHPTFHDLGPTSQFIVAFPTRPIMLTPVGGLPFAAQPGTAVVMSRGQRVLRSPISATGDRCIWIGLDEDTSALALSSVDLPTSRTRDLPFGTAITGSLMTDVRALAIDIAHGAIDDVESHEALFNIALRALRHMSHRRRRTRREHAELVELVAAAAEEMTRAPSPTRINEISASLGISPYRLSRAFRSVLRCSPSDFHRRLRLADSLERLAERDVDLSHIALDAGFASHSHFTLWFRRTFGITPTQYRDRLRGSVTAARCYGPRRGSLKLSRASTDSNSSLE